MRNGSMNAIGIHAIMEKKVKLVLVGCEKV